MNAVLWQAVQTWFDAPFCLRLTQAMLHFLWQGSLLVAAYWLFELVRPQATAKLKYAAGVIALLLMAACLPTTFAILPAPKQPVTSTAATMVQQDANPIATELPATPAEIAIQSTVAKNRNLGAARSHSQPAARDLQRADRKQTIDHGAPATAAVFLTAAAPYITALYFAGTMLMLLRMSAGLWGGHRLRQAATHCDNPAILRLVAEQSRKLSMRFVPSVAWCVRISSPVVVGVLQPIILLPPALATGLSDQQFTAILLHELAHIRRYDLVVNVLQRLIEAPLFFHPAVWWLSHRVSIHREHACDDLALAANGSKLQYAEALLRTAELCQNANNNAHPIAALAATGQTPSQLKHRIMRLLGADEQPRLRLSNIGLLLSVTLVAALLIASTAWRGVAKAENEGVNEQPMPKQPVPKADKPKLRVVATVVDDITDEPIEKFRVVMASSDNGPRPSPVAWQSHTRKAGTNGFFKWEPNRVWEITRWRIDAEGYRPYVSRGIGKDDGEVQLEIRLTPSKGIIGNILSPDGKPANGAEIIACTWTNEVNIENGRIRVGGHARELATRFITEADGAFRLPAECDPWVLVVAHVSGYAEATQEQFNKSSTITLQPWGRLEGEYSVDGNPIVGQLIHVGAGRGDVDILLHYNDSVTTDHKGKFTVDRAPPVRLYVHPMFKTDDGSVSISHFSGLLKIEAGKTTRVKLPRIGKPIMGRIKLPNNSDLRLSDFEFDVTVYLRPPSVSGFQDHVQKSFQAYGEFMASDAGNQFNRRKVAINELGEFRVDGLPESDYVVSVQARQRNKQASASSAIQDGFAAKRITIPPREDETTDGEKAVDVGEIILRLSDRKATQDNESASDDKKPATENDAKGTSEAQLSKSDNPASDGDPPDANIPTAGPTIGTPTIPLKGVVVDSEGHPVAGETVYGLLFSRFPRPDLPKAKTAADGSFELERPAMAGVLQVSNRDAKRAGYVVVDEKQAEAKLRLKPLINAHGTLVNSEGKPVVGAKLGYSIPIDLRNGREPHGILGGTANTNDDGQFTLTNLMPGESFTLHVEKLPEYKDKLLDVKLTTIKVKSDKPIDLGKVTLPELTEDGKSVADFKAAASTLALKGKVVDVAGKPVEGITVEADFLRSPIWRKLPHFAKAKTAADGTFELKRPAVGAVVEARTADHLQGCIQLVDDKQTDISLRLVLLATARGQLVDSAGKPVAGIKVLAQALRPPVGGYRIGSLFSSAITDADGKYELRGLLPGTTFTANVVGEENKFILLTKIKPEKSGTMDLGKTPLPRLAVLASGNAKPASEKTATAKDGKAKTEEGASEPKASTPPEPAVVFCLAETEAADGLIEFPLEGTNKKYYVHPEIIASNWNLLNMTRSPGEQDGTANIDLQFLFADGGAQLQAAIKQHLGKPLAIIVRDGLVSVPIVTNKFGVKTRIAGLSEEEADCISKAISDDFPKTRAALNEEANRLRKEGGQLRLQFAPQEGAKAPQLPIEPKTKPDAEPNADSKAKTKADSKPKENTTPITIFGRAVDKDARPIAGAKIYVASRRGQYKRLAETTSDAEGRYEFRDLPLPLEKHELSGGPGTGAFEVFGQAEGYGFAWRPTKWFYPNDKPNMVPGPGEPQNYDYSDQIQLTLTFPPPAMLRGRIVDDRGEPIPNTVVDIREAGDIPEKLLEENQGLGNIFLGNKFDALNERTSVPQEMKIRKTNADGRFEFDALPPNSRFRMDVRPPGFAQRWIYAVTATGIDRTDGQKAYPDGMEIVFPRTVVVPIQVLDNLGQPAPKVLVNGLSAEASDYASSNAEGRVQLRLPPGEHKLHLLPAIGTPYLITDFERGLKLDDKPITEPLIFRLNPAAVVDIEVVDVETGKGIANADYWVSDLTSGQQRIDHFIRCWEVATRMSHVDRPRTDEHGKLRTLFKPGPYQIGIGRDFMPRGYEAVNPEGQKIECEAGKTIQLKFQLQKKPQPPAAQAP